MRMRVSDELVWRISTACFVGALVVALGILIWRFAGIDSIVDFVQEPFIDSFLSGLLLLFISVRYVPIYLRRLKRPRIRIRGLLSGQFTTSEGRAYEPKDGSIKFALRAENFGDDNLKPIYWHLFIPNEFDAKVLGANARREEKEFTAAPIDDGISWYAGVMQDDIFPRTATFMLIDIILRNPNASSRPIRYAVSTEFGIYPNHVDMLNDNVFSERFYDLPKLDIVV